MGEAQMIFGAGPEFEIERELAQGWPQYLIAQTYATIYAQRGDRADWPRINRAIKDHYKSPSALDRIKKMAWKQMEARHA